MFNKRLHWSYWAYRSNWTSRYYRPTGATGPAGPGTTLDSYAMVHDETNTTVPKQTPLLFQTTNLSSKITYNPATGDFYIPETVYILCTGGQM